MAISHTYRPITRVLASLCVILTLPEVVSAMSITPNILGSLKQTCRTLSKQGEHEYLVVRGQVIESRIKGIEPPVDCVGPEKCHPLQGMAIVYAQIKSNETEGTISVRTKPESYEKLKSMESSYLKPGQSYAFCARKEPAKTSHYIVDHPEIIQPLK